ncbi:MAG: HupE/UreJ family protein [Bacteroidota bacterium]
MSDFELYLSLGLEHITDPEGYDHILFIVALCAVFTWKDWKRVAGLVTAFTLGHSVTLALTTLQVIPLNSDLIEFLIPVTILLTCLYNILVEKTPDDEKFFTPKTTPMWRRYLIAAGFGLIHGMGFANFLGGLLGGMEDIFFPLLSFNIGLEVGQLLIVAISLTLAFVFIKVLKIPFRAWNVAVSALVGLVAIKLIADTWIF